MYKILSLAVVGVLFCGTAWGGPLLNHIDAWTDWDSRTWTGTTHLESASGDLVADVEWAVFGPDNSPYSGPNFTPTAGEFVYAYQVIVQPSLEVNKFWVNMKPSNEANGIGWFDLPGGITPSLAEFGSTDPQNLVSADWTFAGDLLPGEVSAGLAYSSINAPVDWLGFIQDGGQGGTPEGTLPSPGDVIPEPVTLAFLLLVGGVLLTLRRKSLG